MQMLPCHKKPAKTWMHRAPPDPPKDPYVLGDTCDDEDWDKLRASFDASSLVKRSSLITMKRCKLWTPTILLHPAERFTKIPEQRKHSRHSVCKFVKV